MKGIPQGRYTREFRQEAVKLITEEKLSFPEAGRRLSLAPSTLSYWVKAYKAGKLKEIGNMQKPLTELEMELARTKKELAEVKMERDILKKSSRVLCQGVAARYVAMRQMRLHYPLPLMRRIMKVSASGHYAWIDRPHQNGPWRKPGLSLRLRRWINGQDIHMGLSAYSVNWWSKECRLGYAVSNVSRKSLGLGVSRRGNSRLQLTQSTPFP